MPVFQRSEFSTDHSKRTQDPKRKQTEASLGFSREIFASTSVLGPASRWDSSRYTMVRPKQTAKAELANCTVKLYGFKTAPNAFQTWEDLATFSRTTTGSALIPLANIVEACRSVSCCYYRPLSATRIRGAKCSAENEHKHGATRHFENPLSWNACMRPNAC
jgi:hypothetical protein